MGAWGVYDDEDDTTCDLWYDFLEIINDHEEASQEDMEKVACDQQKNDPDKFYQHLKTFLKKSSRKYHFYGSKVVTGVCLHLVKTLMKEERQTQPLYGIPGSSSLSQSLPDNFPDDIREMVVVAIESSFEAIKDEGWKDEIDRKKALNQELYLFSNGTKGNNGKEKIIQNAFLNIQRM